MERKDKKKLERVLKPSGAYLDSLSDFADMLGKLGSSATGAPATGSTKGIESKSGELEDIMKQAEDAAKELLDETAHQIAPATPVTEPVSEVIEDSGASLEELLGRLDSLIGLENIKQNVKSLINYVKVRKLRLEKELPNPPLSLHMVFTGNPGTGKTTVARLLSELYHAIGALSKGQLIEVDRSGLVAGFVGQTAIKTTETIKNAIGGILFIDEAYSLSPDVGNGNDFGREAIETLLKLMEDNRDDLIVIVAGYSEPMEKFIASNPGLESRFNRYITFEDYNADELYEIFSSMCKKSEYALTDEAQQFARDHFSFLYDNRDGNFGNARHVRNFFENIVTVHSDRISELNEHTREDLTGVILSDLEKASLM